MKIQNKLQITVIVFLIGLMFPNFAFAHVLATNGSIGAVLHIDPDDDPIAGSQASFFFEYKDKQNKFDPQNCDCTFSISENGKEIFSQPLFQNAATPSLENASVFYTFPQKDVYQVTVIGKPKTQNAFQAFTLTYDIRVAREANNQTGNTTTNQSQNWLSGHSIHLIGAVIIAIFFIFALIQQYLIDKKTKQKR